jgi:hypothetical protein
MSRPPPASGGQARTERVPSPLNPTAAHAQDVCAERASVGRDFTIEASHPTPRRLVSVSRTITTREFVTTQGELSPASTRRRRRPTRLKHVCCSLS